MNGYLPICAGILSALLTYALNWLALRPWRRSIGTHWSERARLLYPARVAAGSTLVVLPGIMLMIVVVLWPASTLLWASTGVVSMLGAYAGTLPLEHEIFPRATLGELGRQMFIGTTLRSLSWAVFIGAIVLMPDHFGGGAWAVGGLVLAGWIFWSRGGYLWLWRTLARLAPAPPRLQQIAAATSATMGIPYREVLMVRSPLAQALALTHSRRLVFSERLLELLTDEEIAAVCAHELAHLTEPKSVQSVRSLQSLALLPWIFIRPLMHTYGMAAYFGILAFTVAMPRVFRRFSRTQEARADQIATTHERNAGVYARALLLMYADNQMPAVNPTQGASHPHLYDRILAAGVTPDFPRPLPPRRMAANGWIWSMLAGALIGCLMIRARH